MLVLISFIIVVYMFYRAAKEAGQSAVLWVTYAVGLFLLLGLIFLIVTERYILHINTVEDSITEYYAKTFYSAVSMVIIVAVSYLIQSKFLPKKK